MVKKRFVIKKPAGVKKVALAVADREGVLTFETFEQFHRVMALITFLDETEKAFKEQIGRHFDLHCSLDAIDKVLKMDAPVKVFYGTELPDNRIQYSMEPVTPGEDASEELKEYIRRGAEYVGVVGITEEGERYGHSRLFNEVLKETEKMARSQWEIIQKGE